MEFCVGQSFVQASQWQLNLYGSNALRRSSTFHENEEILLIMSAIVSYNVIAIKFLYLFNSNLPWWCDTLVRMKLKALPPSQ